MSSMWRKAMHYLGLGPDDEYEDDYGYGYDEGAPGGPVREPMRPEAPARSAMGGEPQRPDAVRPRPMTVDPQPRTPVEGASVRPLPAGSAREPMRASGSVRAVPALPKTHVVAPTSFNDAQEMGDRFKASQPVLMDLSGVDRELSRRLIDFSSGLCYALGGQMERLVAQSYLITPAGMEVSAEERRRLTARIES
jgi:cell division inhibitor SepF